MSELKKFIRDFVTFPGQWVEEKTKGHLCLYSSPDILRTYIQQYL